jgi:hypothetical protein
LRIRAPATASACARGEEAGDIKAAAAANSSIGQRCTDAG